MKTFVSCHFIFWFFGFLNDMLQMQILFHIFRIPK